MLRSCCGFSWVLRGMHIMEIGFSSPIIYSLRSALLCVNIMCFLEDIFVQGPTFGMRLLVLHCSKPGNVPTSATFHQSVCSRSLRVQTYNEGVGPYFDVSHQTSKCGPLGHNSTLVRHFWSQCYRIHKTFGLVLNSLERVSTCVVHDAQSERYRTKYMRS